MRLATLSVGGTAKVVIEGPDGLIDVSATARNIAPDDPWVNASMRELLAGGDEAWLLLRRVASCGSAAVLVDPPFKYLPPIVDPPRIFCVGRNYEEHAKEGNADVPAFPMIFLKPATSLNGHESEVSVPASTNQVDWEGELAVAIGRAGRDIEERNAWSHIAGFTVANDLTARDWQRRTSQFDAGKMFDGFGPVGPFLVTPDEVPDVSSLELVTRVNGEVMQTGAVRDMVFSIPFLIAYLSQAVRLLPGDLILTGTPAGVGYARQPPVFLNEGDSVEIAISGIGHLRSPISRMVNDSFGKHLGNKSEEEEEILS